jgi:hypothetical protein
MKIEKTVSIKTFDEIEDGEVFKVEGGESIFLRIETDGICTRKGTHDGLAVNLETGAVTYFDDDEKVIVLPNAKVVC